MGKHALRIYGIGADVARVARVQRSYERFGDRFLRKAFHADEIAEFRARPDDQKPLFLASRWAAKEATFKAFQRFRVLFPEICVSRQSSSAATDDDLLHQIHTALPVAQELKARSLQFSGETAALAQQLQLQDAHVSLSHDGDYAMAFVVLQQRVPPTI